MICSRGGAEPSTQDIAECAGISPEEVVEHLLLMQEPVSIERSKHAEDNPLRDVLPAPPTLLSNEETAPSLFADVGSILVCELSERERRVIELRFGLCNGVPYPPKEVAMQLHLSPIGVQKIEARALKKIHAALGGKDA